MDTIKPIETSYNGRLFRSRLEARHAVFFDTLGIPYEYEKEGFDLGPDGYYLPDFWLPQQEVWYEIKGDTPSIFECGLCERIASMGHSAVICWGQVLEPNLFGWHHHRWGTARWYLCRNCGQHGIRIGAASLGSCGCPQTFYIVDETGIRNARMEAQRARFEYDAKWPRPHFDHNNS